MLRYLFRRPKYHFMQQRYFLAVPGARNLCACPANFRPDKVDEFESGSLTLQVEMNADADTAHRKFDRMHARYRIPINRSAGHWKCHRPLGPLIKEFHVTKEMSLLLVEEQQEWRRRRRRRAFVNSAKMNGRENASRTKGAGWRPAFRKFFSPPRGRTVLRSRSLIFLLSPPSRHSCPPSHFPLWLARADALAPIAIS